jgi:hypothetical protein
MYTQINQRLTSDNISNLFGKIIKWTAPSSNINAPYEGICRLVSLNGFNEKRPIVSVTIYGDDLEFARLTESGEFVYSDDYRFVTFKEVATI